MNKDELVDALRQEDWHKVWIAAIHGALPHKLVDLVLASNAPDWLKNVFGTVKPNEPVGEENEGQKEN